MQIESGKTYYFGIGVRDSGPSLQSALNQAASGSSGQQLPSTSPIRGAMAGTVLFQIDAAQGPAIIAQLKPK